MATEILGLPSSAKFAAEGDRFHNHRRQILHSFPNGKSPLTGLLSMIPEEPTDDSIIYWYEKRYKSPVMALRGTNPVTTTAPSTGDADDGTVITTGAKAETVDIYIKVDTTVDVKPGNVLYLDTNGASFYVLEVNRGSSTASTNGYLKVRLVRGITVASVATEFAAASKLRVIGSAYGEGQSGRGKRATAYKRPYRVENTTQIFSDTFEFPGSVLQMGTKWDKTGVYKEKAFDTVIDHMTGIERSLFFGKRSTQDRASFDSDQEALSVRTFSGILEFLELWDAGSTGLTIDGATYAPYSFKSQSTSDDDDQKRIITNASGSISVRKWHTWAERCGRYHSNKSNEKLVLCGSGAVIACAEMFRLNSTFNVKYGDKAYGLTITTVTTPFGDFHLVTHPLFNEDPVWTNWMFFLDIHQLKWRPLRNRDTKLLKNRQNNGDDFRRDEFLTEASFEMHNPDSCMLVKNVTKYVED